MTFTIVGIVSIVIGFCCVMGAYYTFQKGEPGSNRTVPIVLGLLALVFLTIIPAGPAVFFAAPGGQQLP